MRKSLYIIPIIVFVALLAPQVNAQDYMMGTNSAKPEMKNKNVRALTNEKLQQLQANKQQFQQQKDQFQQQKAQFKERINSISDQRKKMVVEKIDNNITNINTKLTSVMSNAINRISSVLEQLSLQPVLQQQRACVYTSYQF